MAEIVVYITVVALLMGVPWVIDIIMAYKSQGEIRRLLINKASVNGITPTELRELLKACKEAPGGIQGLSRASMALSVILILGIAIFHLLVNGKGTDGESQIISNVLSLLGGLLAAITGFYFGGRAAEEKADKVAEKGAEKPTPPAIT